MIFTIGCIISSACIIVKNPINDYQKLSNNFGYIILGFGIVFIFTSILFFCIAYIVKNNYLDKQENNIPPQS
ncbi:hypothetical protein [Spiroplasma endosymbiont of Amphimallon solstitiale]|uniref:hypothetical protein n=1 Tax=Spiroplasma endosymbiont of Amphimallon solstitiale TaxID=3066288 RepID=UPI00313A9654